MTGVALKGLLGRKTRALLTAFAIVLGVGMVSGTYIFTDTIQKAFDSVFTTSYKDTSVVVTGRKIVTGSATSPTVPASLLGRVQAVPGVEAASGGFLFDTVKLVGADGKAIGGGSPQFGFGVDATDPRFNPLELTAGHWAHGPGQIVIGAATAAQRHYELGDTIGAKGEDGPVSRYTITGFAEVGGDVSIGGATIAAFDVPTARIVLDQPGRFDAISVIARPGVSPAQLVSRLEPVLPQTVEVQTAEAQAASDAKAVGDIAIVRYALLGFAGIALFVGAFVIFNTISMTVAQRTREFATLRTLGASRRQVLRTVLLESVVLGAIASAVGLALGFGLATALTASFSQLPQAGIVVAPKGVAISLLTGILVTVLAGLLPALRATRVPPISAVREGAELPPSRFARYKPYAAAGVTIVAVLAIAAGIFGGGDAKTVLIPAAAGTLLLFVGVAMLSSYLVPPLVQLVGGFARRFGGPAGRLAIGNSRRNPSRTAATASALMIGLALVTFVATLASGLEISTKDDLNRQVTSDYVVDASSESSSGFFSPATGRALAAVPGVTAVSAVRADKARVFGSTQSVTGVDGATIGKAYRFAWKQGSDAVLADLGNGAIVDSGYAKTHHLAIGSRLPVETSTGARHTFVVRATYHPKFQPVLGAIVVSQAAFDRTFPKPADQDVFVNTASGASPATTAQLDRAVGRFADVEVATTPSWIKTQADGIKTVLAIFYAFLAMSVIVSLFGMVNTLILSVFERTREIGMLRAVGMTRRQLRRMIRHESIITALIGAALGLPLGVFLAAIVTRGLSGQGVSFHVPVEQLMYFAYVAVAAGVWAAVLPARRASKLNVLEALQYE